MCVCVCVCVHVCVCVCACMCACACVCVYDIYISEVDGRGHIFGSFEMIPLSLSLRLRQVLLLC